MADSAYTSTRTVVPAFKQAPGQPLPPDKQKFNFKLSHNRVIVEHTIGMLKNRWQSMKLLSLEILKAEWDILKSYVPNFDSSKEEEEDSGVIDGEDLTLCEQLFTRFCQLL
ncbi:hypothetical protein PGT21_010631 [Puccinia graminis f. sp. tritici]|uniref:DDE Tnp4 domain-containing protein n=1 Tax=Puccinia graminis f. sp. tritici TaxID=56615 RepID=A0A5B0Q2L9_PUCGR|nr:hypothetical protein PGT21_010631 [Puccinia graminis f. sp. tritici]KAA1124852.1 hypothetical protein PGTUg99_035980 [Puccinia graminis f. sp. tritici]